MKKINLEVMCKRNRFGYWNSCKRLPKFLKRGSHSDGLASKIYKPICPPCCLIILRG